MNKFMLSCIVMLAISCIFPAQSGTSSPYQEMGDKTDAGTIQFKGGDGSSMENALIIQGAKNEIEAIPAEIDYISKKHGERDKTWKLKMQSDFKINDRVYVEYQIEDYRKGATASYFFDNTSLYSVFLKDTGARAAKKQVQKAAQPASQPAGETAENSVVRYKGGDGSSMETAIIIIGPKKEKELIKAEIDYISRRHGEKNRYWKVIMQSDFKKNDRNYVEYQIEDFKKGIKTAYFFDNTPDF